MKKIFILLAIVILGSNSVYAAAHIMFNTRNFNDRGRYATVASYDCNFREVQCNVAKVRLMQTGRTYYDSECFGSKFENNKFKHRAASDVRLKRFDYCKISSRTVVN